MADCPSCGAPLAADARFCRRCGVPAPAGAHPLAAPEDDQPTLVVAPDDTTPTLHLDEEPTLPGQTPAAAASADAVAGAAAGTPDAPAASAFPGAPTVTTPVASSGTAGTPAAAAFADVPTDTAPAAPDVADEAGAADAEQTIALGPEELPVAPDANAAAGPDAVPAAAWSCPVCGARGAAADLFCGRCGAGRPQDAPTICAACGAALESDMVFCPRCGARAGDIETAAARQETAVLPAAVVAAAVAPAPAAPPPSPATQPPSAPPPVDRPPSPAPPAPPSPAGKPGRRGTRWAVLAVVVVVLAAIAAGVYFGFFYDRGGPQDAIAPIEPLIASVVPEQKAVNAALESLAPDEQSLAALTESADALRTAIEDAAADAEAIAVDDEQAVAILKAFDRALATHREYAAALADLPADPAGLTAAEVDIATTRAASAQAAYEDLATLAPTLPAMPFPAAAIDKLAAVATEVEQQAGELAVLQTFLTDIEALFPDSRDERLTAENILAQLEATEIPPDNAGGQMAAQAVRLRSVAARIDAIAAPDDQRAEQIQATYREAVGHSVTAARQYARWMAHLWDYYQVSGDWPPAYGIEADTYLDPAYDAARQAADLATAAREELATQIDSLTQALGGSAAFAADDM